MPNSDQLFYKFYYAGAVDVRKKVIFNYEIFYDPFYIELWNRMDNFYAYDWVELSEEKPEKFIANALSPAKIVNVEDIERAIKDAYASYHNPILVIDSTNEGE